MGVLLLALSAGGCMFIEDVDKPRAFNRQVWQEELAEDRVRLAGIDAAPDFFAGIIRLWDDLTDLMGEPAVAARRLLSPWPDDRAEGITLLASKQRGRREPNLTAFAYFAGGDPGSAGGVGSPGAAAAVPADKSPLVRSAAIRALNYARDGSRTPLFVAALDDPSELVRLEAAKALANVPDAAAIPALAKRLADVAESQETRVAAADALRCYRDRAAVQALIRALDDRSFAVVWRARLSLRLIAGEDYGYDPAAWLAWLLRTRL